MVNFNLFKSLSLGTRKELFLGFKVCHKIQWKTNYPSEKIKTLSYLVNLIHILKHVPVSLPNFEV